MGMRTTSRLAFSTAAYYRCLLTICASTHPTHTLHSPACRCLAECKEWEECLTMLGGLDVEEPEQLSFPMPRATPGTINYLSVVCLLRGQVYDALENYPRATKWYRAALTLDPFNYEVRERVEQEVGTYSLRFERLRVATKRCKAMFAMDLFS